MSFFFHAAAKCDYRLISNHRYSVDRAFERLREADCSILSDQQLAPKLSSEKRDDDDVDEARNDAASKSASRDASRSPKQTLASVASVRLIAKHLAENSRMPKFPTKEASFRRRIPGMLFSKKNNNNNASRSNSEGDDDDDDSKQRNRSPDPVGSKNEIAAYSASASVRGSKFSLSSHHHHRISPEARSKSSRISPVSNSSSVDKQQLGDIGAERADSEEAHSFDSAANDATAPASERRPAVNRCVEVFERARRFNEELREKSEALMHSQKRLVSDTHRLDLKVDDSHLEMHLPEGMTAEARSVLYDTGVADYMAEKKRAADRAAALEVEQQRMSATTPVTTSMVLQMQAEAARAKQRLEMRGHLQERQGAARDKLDSLISLVSSERCESMNSLLLHRRLEKAGQAREREEKEHEEEEEGAPKKKTFEHIRNATKQQHQSSAVRFQL